MPRPTSTFRPRAVAGCLLLLLLVAPACNNGGSGGGGDGKGEGGGSGSGAGSDFTTGQQPVAVTGINLVDYDNARVRCDYKQTATANTYSAQCAVVAHQASGQEMAAASLKAGVSLNWQAPQSLRGAMSFASCNPQDGLLAYNCLVTITNTQSLAEAGFSFQIQDSAHPARTETASLLLPYSVGIAGGFVPSMPYQYVGTGASGSTTTLASLADPLQQLGFQQFDFAANLTPVAYPFGMVMCGSRLFYASSVAIFQVVGGRVSYYAGSSNSQDGTTGTNAKHLYLQPDYLACASGGVYVGSIANNSIYKILDDGSATLVAGLGSGTGAQGPDGSKANTVAISDPRGIAVNSKGDLVYASQATHMVRMVTHDGILKTIAGTGQAGNSGDHGPATQATLSTPLNVAVGPDDSVYVADTDAAVVRKIDPSGIISTIAGTGTQRYADPTNPRALSEPTSLYVDGSGAVFVGERMRGVKKVLSGGSLVQIISVGPDIMQRSQDMLNDVFTQQAQGVHSPNTYVVDSRPNFFYLAKDDTGTFYTDGHEGVIAFPSGTSTATVFVGAADSAPGGCTKVQSAFLTRFYEASAVAILPNHSLSVLDYLSLSSDQLVLHTLTPGGGAGGQALATDTATLGCQPTPELVGFNPVLSYPANSIGGLAAASDGSLVFANMGQSLLVKISAQGTISTLAGSGSRAYTPDGGLATAASLQTPIGVALGPDGSIYFVEYGPASTQAAADGSRLRRISPQGILSTVAGTGVGGDSGEGLPATEAQIRANTVAVGKDGRIYLADFGNNKIKMIDTQGVIHTIAGGGNRTISKNPVDALQVALANPSSIAIGNDNTIYFVNFAANQVEQLKPQAGGGWLVSSFFGAKATSDCGTSTIAGTAAAPGISSAIQNSLSIMCQGAPRTVTVYDSCPAAGGDTRIAITQSSDQYTNIVQVVKPCGT